MRKREFFFKVAEAMSGCQAVEQALKLYITKAFTAVQQRVSEVMTFKMSGRDYDDAPLGNLIKVFSKLVDDKQLVEDLKKFTKERNYLSHRAIYECLDPSGEVDLVEFAKFEPRLNAIGPEAARLGQAIFVADMLLEMKIGVEGFEDVQDDEEDLGI